MKIAALQMDIVWERREDNYQEVARQAEAAKAAGADLLILPEMFSTGFSMNTAVTSEPADGPTMQFLSALAKKHQLNIVAGVVLGASENRARNTAVAITPDGEEIARYTKMQLFSYAKEDRSHEAGHRPVPFTINGVRCACFICYDLRFPSLFRSINDQCDLYIVIASWPAPRQHHWDILLPARAVENQAYVVGVNRVGQGDGLLYTGGSRVIDPNGRTVADAGEKPRLIYGDIDTELVASIRRELPFLHDRRNPNLT